MDNALYNWMKEWVDRSSNTRNDKILSIFGRNVHIPSRIGCIYWL
jgi:hypothetical protein